MGRKAPSWVGMSSPMVYVRAAALLWALVVVPLAIVGLFCMVTWRGAGLMGTILAMGVGPLLWCIGDERESKRQKTWGSAFVWLGLIAFCGLAQTELDSESLSGSRIDSRFSKGEWRFDRFSIGNLLPEIDQIHLGYLGAHLLDPLLDKQQLRDLSSMTDRIYEELGQDEDFCRVGSALPWMWREITFSEFRSGHYFHLLPEGVDRTKPIPTLVFLHGSGGNFLAYMWLLSKVSERTGFAVIAPTFGMGNWEKEGAYGAVKAAIEDAGRFQAVDPNGIHLMGLSNGGKGVCLAESTQGPKFQSVIFLSAVWNDSVSPKQFAERLKGRSALVISGGNDNRVPWSYVSGYAEALRIGGMDVTSREFPEDDHFVFFRRRQEVEEELVHWLKSRLN
jgi:predicted esterase